VSRCSGPPRTCRARRCACMTTECSEQLCLLQRPGSVAPSRP
jgi:hypothetical protein